MEADAEEEAVIQKNKEESNGGASGLTLELITELLCHHRIASPALGMPSARGTLSSHFRGIYDHLHEPSWLARSQLQVEVEVGSIVGTVAAPPSPSSTAPSPASSMPLLLRAFQRRQATDVRAANHCLIITGRWDNDR